MRRALNCLLINKVCLGYCQEVILPLCFLNRVHNTSNVDTNMFSSVYGKADVSAIRRQKGAYRNSGNHATSILGGVWMSWGKGGNNRGRGPVESSSKTLFILMDAITQQKWIVENCDKVIEVKSGELRLSISRYLPLTNSHFSNKGDCNTASCIWFS